MSMWSSVMTAHKRTSVSPLLRRKIHQGGGEARYDLVVGNTNLLMSDYTNPSIFSFSLLSENAYISAVISQIKQLIMICTVGVQNYLHRRLVELVAVWQIHMVCTGIRVDPAI